MKFQTLKVKTPEEILISDIDYLKDIFELKFWKDIVRKLVDKETMQGFYNEVDVIREK